MLGIAIAGLLLAEARRFGALFGADGVLVARAVGVLAAATATGILAAAEGVATADKVLRAGCVVVGLAAAGVVGWLAGLDLTFALAVGEATVEVALEVCALA